MISRNVVLTTDRLEAEVKYFLKQDAFVFDLEAQGEYRNVPTRCDVTWVGLATYGRTVVVPMGHPIGSTIIGYGKEPRTDKNGTVKNFKVPIWDAPPKQIRPSEAWDILRPLFLSPDIVKGAQNAPYDLIGSAKYLGQVPEPPYDDTIVMQWLLDENLHEKGLKAMVRAYYGVDYDKENIGRNVEIHPFNKVARYNYLDAKYTWLLRKKFLDLLKLDGIGNIYRLERDLIPVLCAMGLTGTGMDMNRLRELDVELSAKVVEAEGEVYRAAGRTFNINSPAQRQEVLYLPKSKGGQGLKGMVLTDGGKKRKKSRQKIVYTDYSTSSEALENYPENPVVQKLEVHGEYNKLLSTYVRNYLHGNPEKNKLPVVMDGRVHAEFVQYGTVTGRFSCREPNLQNIPIRTDAGRLIRELFITDPGYKMLVADYDQIELRIMAHYAGRGKLFEGFQQGIDPHTATAAAIFGVPVDQVTSKMRDMGKGINFATGYGAGPTKIAQMAGVSVKDAEKFVAIHEEQFPEIYALKAEVIAACRSRRPPYIKTILGRKRRLPAIFARDNGVRMGAERQAFNSLIQGSQADLMKLAMVRLHRRLPQVPGMKIVLTVHDELVSLCPEHLVEDGKRIIAEAMRGPAIQKYLKVALAADVKAVDRWSDAKG